MRIILDTNIYIAAALYKGLAREILDFVFENSLITLIISEEILHELRSKLNVKFHWSDKRINFYLDSIKVVAKAVNSSEKLPGISRDPKDDKILECALSGDADLIVTLDQDLIKIKKFRGIGIIHPKTLYWTFPDHFKEKE